MTASQLHTAKQILKKRPPRDVHLAEDSLPSTGKAEDSQTFDDSLP
jgi:hypothetical protein